MYCQIDEDVFFNLLVFPLFACVSYCVFAPAEHRNHVLTIWQLVATSLVPHLRAVIEWGLHTTAQRLTPRNVPNTAK